MPKSFSPRVTLILAIDFGHFTLKYQVVFANKTYLSAKWPCFYVGHLYARGSFHNRDITFVYDLTRSKLCDAVWCNQYITV